MKNKVLKAVVTMGVVAVLSACGDDPAGPNPGPTSSTSNDPCASVVAISDAWLFTADQTYVIYPDGRVTDAAGNVVGQFAEGVITALGGTQIAAGVDVGVLKVCPANATVNPDGSRGGCSGFQRGCRPRLQCGRAPRKLCRGSRLERCGRAEFERLRGSELQRLRGS